jgi:glycosyltransferase involved in cell wall biosynthesis
MDAAPILLLPVRITRRKNIEFALHVLACLRESTYPSANMIVTGPPGPHNPANQEYFESLRQIRRELNLEGCVHFLAEQRKTYLPHNIIADLYRLADVLILPSKEEGFGLPLLEAGVTKLPIFCSEIPPLKEIGGNCVTYFSLKASPNQVAGLIARELDNDPAYKLRSRICQNHTWEHIYRQISEGLLNQAISQTSPKQSQGEDHSRSITNDIESETPRQFTWQTNLSDNLSNWLQTNTFHANQFNDLEHLLKLKQLKETTLSLVLPAFNVANTLEEIIKTIQIPLVEQIPLIDEIVVIDSGSDDETCTIAEKYRIPVFKHSDILPEYGVRSGKGEALWKSLYVTRGDIIVWIDTDIQNINPGFLFGLFGPLLFRSDLQFIKGFYRRPLKFGDQIIEDAGGRVTELVARPLLNLYYPELSTIMQPLAGEYAGRRTLLEQFPFFTGFGVEVGLLLDVYEKYGLEVIGQVDLDRRVHYNKPLRELSRMSFSVMQAFMQKAEHKLGQSVRKDISNSLVLWNYLDNEIQLEVLDIDEQERPPMIELPEYHKRSLSP